MNGENLVIKPKKLKGEDGHRSFSIRVEEKLICQIDDISEKTGYSRNKIIGMLLSYAIKHCKIEQ